MSAPPISDVELLRRCAQNLPLELHPEWYAHVRSIRFERGRTLLHVARESIPVLALLEAGLDPNAADDHGCTPVLTPKSRSALRLLLDAGADPSARDASGRGVLEVQCVPYPGAAGYVAPDLATLDMLLEAGMPRPTLVEVETIVREIGRCVCSAGEAADASRCEHYLRGIARDLTKL